MNPARDYREVPMDGPRASALARYKTRYAMTARYNERAEREAARLAGLEFARRVLGDELCAEVSRLNTQERWHAEVGLFITVEFAGHYPINIRRIEKTDRIVFEIYRESNSYRAQQCVTMEGDRKACIVQQFSALGDALLAAEKKRESEASAAARRCAVKFWDRVVGFFKRGKK